MEVQFDDEQKKHDENMELLYLYKYVLKVQRSRSSPKKTKKMTPTFLQVVSKVG